MIRNTRRITLLISMLFMLGLNACAITKNIRQAEQPAAQPADVSYEVKAGDRLSDIAQTLTGKASNWQRIATYNNISDPKSLVAGDVLRVPQTLLRQIYTLGAQAQDAVIEEKAAITPSAPATLPVTTGNGFSVARGRNTTTETSAAINISAVEVNRSFELQPLTEPLFASVADNDSAGTTTVQVKVVGSYYPKGLYDEPANYARLIQRVSPGTVFTLEAQVNDWYKVISDKGVGYLRANDGVLVK